jgi:hypothetical protein
MASELLASWSTHFYFGKLSAIQLADKFSTNSSSYSSNSFTENIKIDIVSKGHV